MKRILAGGLLLCLLLYCAGCGQTEDPSKETPVIGYSIDSLIIERWQRDRDVFVSAANQLGAEVDVQDAGGDVDKQIDLALAQQKLNNTNNKTPCLCPHMKTTGSFSQCTECQ